MKRRDYRADMELASLAADVEGVALPPGNDERFAGYGIMGLPFSSGHVLAMRRFPASSIGPDYTSVWHRTPDGTWTFWQDRPSALGCGRYFSGGVAAVDEADIVLDWTASDTLEVSIPSVGLHWRSTMISTPMSKAFNVIGSAVPLKAWRSAPLLRAMGPVAGRLLGVGSVGLAGTVPNGQSFVANPMRIWYVASAEAQLGDTAFGLPGPLGEQARLGDLFIPQKGVFALGRAFFT